MALASGSAITLGDVVCNVKNELPYFAPFFSALAYIVAAVLVVQGVMLLKKHADNPNDSQIVKAAAHLFAGGALGVLPYAVGTLQASLHLMSGGGGTASLCEKGAVVQLTTSAGLDIVMQNFVRNIYSPMFKLISAICIVMGIFLIFRGLLKGAKVGSDPRAAATHAIAANLVVGAILVSIASMLSTMFQSLFGSTNVNNMTTFVTNYGINWNALVGSGVDTTAADNTMAAVLAFVQIIGAIAFVRGWLMIRNAIEGTAQVTVPQGLTHVIGGAMAINIGTMIRAFDATFGTGLLKTPTA